MIFDLVEHLLQIGQQTDLIVRLERTEDDGPTGEEKETSRSTYVDVDVQQGLRERSDADSTLLVRHGQRRGRSSSSVVVLHRHPSIETKERRRSRVNLMFDRSGDELKCFAQPDLFVRLQRRFQLKIFFRSFHRSSDLLGVI